MKKKRFFRKPILVLIIFCIALGFYGGYRIYKVPNKKDLLHWNVVDAQDTSKKFMTKDTLVKEISAKQKLIITEVDLKETLVLNNSWGNFDIFKKIKSVCFSAKGVYTIDLSHLKPENITMNNKEKLITIKIPNPKIEMITIDEEKTIYESTQNGLFRFGEIKVTPEEHQLMLKHVKEQMNAKIKEQEYYSQAENNTKKVLKQLVKSIVNSDKTTYNVSIEFQSN